jgi:hypothetical protein
MRGTSASSWQLLGAQPIGPHAGGVDHVVGAQLEALAAHRIAHAGRRGCAPDVEQVGDLHPVGAHRAEALGLASTVSTRRLSSVWQS